MVLVHEWDQGNDQDGTAAMNTRLESLGNHSMLRPTTPSTETLYPCHEYQRIDWPWCKAPHHVADGYAKGYLPAQTPSSRLANMRPRWFSVGARTDPQHQSEISDPFVFVGIVCTGVLRRQSHRDGDSDSPKQPRDHLNTNSPKQPRDHLNGWYRRPISIELNQPPLSPSSAGYRS